MRKMIILLAAAAAVLGVATVAFEANATIGGGLQGLQLRESSLRSRRSIARPGMFCPRASTLECDPLCVLCELLEPREPSQHHKAEAPISGADSAVSNVCKSPELTSVRVSARASDARLDCPWRSLAAPGWHGRAAPGRGGPSFLAKIKASRP